MSRLGTIACGLFGCVLVASCSRGPSSEPSGERSSAVAATAAPVCPASLLVQPGDTLENISRRCYGSRTYQALIAEHNHHGQKQLRAGETLDVPPFEMLVREALGASKWSAEADPIAAAFEHYRSAQPEIEGQLRRAPPGFAGYQPSERARTQLDAAAAALRPLVARLHGKGGRTRKFAQALETIEQLAGGKGQFSTDYAVEELHQCFSYGIEALR